MGEQKFVRLFGRYEIYLTVCAATKNATLSSLLGIAEFFPYFWEPNQFWQRDPNHERALLKIYKRDSEKDLTCGVDTQSLSIPMPFWGHDSSDSWGELQFLIKRPAAVKLARHRCFDTRVNQWVEETKPIQPKTDMGTHAYLALRFYHQDYLPPVPGDWRFEPVFVSIRNSEFYRVDVLWRAAEIKTTMTMLNSDSLEIPKHLK